MSAAVATSSASSASLNAQLDAIYHQVSGTLAANMNASELAFFGAQFAPDKDNPYPVPAVGSKAPQFSLQDQQGRSVSLSELVASGQHTILLWYRGEWCPFCAATLKAYNAQLAAFTRLNARVVAITPTLSTITAGTVATFGLGFPVLSDPGNAVAKQYGALNQLSEDLARVHEKLGFLKWEQVYGDSTHTLPHPATFVIEANTGKIALGRVETDFRKRVDPQEVLQVLSTLSN